MLAEVADQRRRIGERIAALREKSRLTQDEVAHAAGVAPRTYVRWEHGEAFPYWRNLEKLAKVFGTTVEDILGELPAVDPEPLEAPDMHRLEEKVDRLTEAVIRLTERLNDDDGGDATDESSGGPPPPSEIQRRLGTDDPTQEDHGEAANGRAANSPRHASSDR